MSAWYIAIHGQMLPDYSQNINLVAAAPSRGSGGYWKHRPGTRRTHEETCPHTITISNNTAPGEMPWWVVGVAFLFWIFSMKYQQREKVARLATTIANPSSEGSWLWGAQQFFNTIHELFLVGLRILDTGLNSDREYRVPSISYISICDWHQSWRRAAD